MTKPALVSALRGGCGGGLGLLSLYGLIALPFECVARGAREAGDGMFIGNTVDARLRGRSPCDTLEELSGSFAVVDMSDTNDMAELLAGETGAARCAGFLAIGGGALGFG